MLVLGHGAAGKTSLLNAIQQTLLKKKVTELTNTESTIGFDELQIQLPDKVRYSIYDFAGTEYITSNL